MPQDKNISLEDKIKKLKSENRSLKNKITSLRSENIDLQKLAKWEKDILTSSPSGIMVLQQGIITYANKTILDQLDYKIENVVDRKFFEFVHPDNVKKDKELYKKLFAGKKIPEQYETLLLNDDGDGIGYDIIINSARLKGRKAFLLNLIRAENRKALESEKIVRGKKQVIKTMTFGICNLINRFTEKVTRNTNDLRAKIDDEDSKTNRILAELRDAVYKTQQVCNNLKLISTAGIRKDSWELVSVSEIVTNTVTEVMRRLKVGPTNINIKTFLRSKSRIKGDPERIREMLENMILNAIEAMPNGGDIYITTEDNTDHCYIYIQDTGEGIPDHLKLEIFDPFFTTRGEKGRGLGLSLCDSIIRHHEGSIGLSSSMGQGAMFEIKLPIPKQKANKKTKSTINKIQNIHVLLIQNEDFIRELMAQFFRDKGCKIDTAISGLEGLGKIKKGKLDLVIADNDLPDIDSKSFIKKIRMINSKLVFVLINGHKDDQLSASFAKPIADLILTKPLDVNNAVNQALGLLINRE